MKGVKTVYDEATNIAFEEVNRKCKAGYEKYGKEWIGSDESNKLIAEVFKILNSAKKITLVIDEEKFKKSGWVFEASIQ
jgi:hypothetical protein